MRNGKGVLPVALTAVGVVTIFFSSSSSAAAEQSCEHVAAAAQRCRLHRVEPLHALLLLLSLQAEAELEGLALLALAPLLVGFFFFLLFFFLLFFFLLFFFLLFFFLLFCLLLITLTHGACEKGDATRPLALLLLLVFLHDRARGCCRRRRAGAKGRGGQGRASAAATPSTAAAPAAAAATAAAVPSGAAKVELERGGDKGRRADAEHAHGRHCRGSWGDSGEWKACGAVGWEYVGLGGGSRMATCAFPA